MTYGTRYISQIGIRVELPDREIIYPYVFWSVAGQSVEDYYHAHISRIHADIQKDALAHGQAIMFSEMKEVTNAYQVEVNLSYTEGDTVYYLGTVQDPVSRPKVKKGVIKAMTPSLKNLNYKNVLGINHTYHESESPFVYEIERWTSLSEQIFFCDQATLLESIRHN